MRKVRIVYIDKDVRPIVFPAKVATVEINTNEAAVCVAQEWAEKNKAEIVTIEVVG